MIVTLFLCFSLFITSSAIDENSDLLQLGKWFVIAEVPQTHSLDACVTSSYDLVPTNDVNQSIWMTRTSRLFPSVYSSTCVIYGTVTKVNNTQTTSVWDTTWFYNECDLSDFSNGFGFSLSYSTSLTWEYMDAHSAIVSSPINNNGDKAIALYSRTPILQNDKKKALFNIIHDKFPDHLFRLREITQAQCWPDSTP